jgi:hypothetical protein
MFLRPVCYAVFIFLWIIAGCTKGGSDIEPEAEARIKKSVFSRDDNANGSHLKKQGIEIREITNFYYNESDLLDSFYLFYDSLQVNLARSLKVTYTDSNVYFLEEYDRGKTFYNEYHFNDKKQLTKIRNVFNPDLTKGIFISYFNDRISNIKLVLNETIELSNFLYDSKNNLLQYTLKDENGIVYLIQYTYDTDNFISQQLDIKFGVVDLLHWYAGGVNVMNLIGLNLGLGNSNHMMERIEKLQATDELLRSYKFSYSQNSQNQIVGRNIILNDTISVFYQYYY